MPPSSGGWKPPHGELNGLVSRIEAEGAYINFYFDPAAMAASVVEEALVANYGAGAPTSKRMPDTIAIESHQRRAASCGTSYPDIRSVNSD